MLLQTAAYRDATRPRALAIWLAIVAAMIVAIVVVGGITRLTESGLSITEWKPVTGTLPPLSEAAWQAEFARYRQIPQFAAFGGGMTLAGFKAIFFWEYLHRLLGRLIGMAMILPFVWFAVRRRIPAGYAPRLLALLALIGLQGTLGWLMVRSGLTHRTEVAPIWLAAHLLTAMVTLGGMVWTALDLLRLSRDRLARPARPTMLGAAALAVLLLQIVMGALTAGLRAGYAFASWPLMGDSLYPAEAPLLSPAWRNLVDNPIAVQFVHRWLAFAAAALLVALAFRAIRLRSIAGQAVAGLVLIQIALGIATLLSGVKIDLAVAHQANAALLLIATVAAAHTVAASRAKGPSIRLVS